MEAAGSSHLVNLRGLSLGLILDCFPDISSSFTRCFFPFLSVVPDLTPPPPLSHPPSPLHSPSCVLSILPLMDTPLQGSVLSFEDPFHSLGFSCHLCTDDLSTNSLNCPLHPRCWGLSAK